MRSFRIDPAYLTSYDGHTGWANSAALKLAGITRRSKNPADGIIVKDARTGEPTGVLKEAAMSLMSAHLPQAHARRKSGRHPLRDRRSSSPWRDERPDRERIGGGARDLRRASKVA